MSATNRGSERVEHDFYETPEWLTQALLPHLSTLRKHPTPAILEPSAGRGAISRVVRAWWPMATIDQIDLVDRGVPGIVTADFLAEDFGNTWYDFVITNPPYNLAQEFVTKALTLAPIVAMLLRINFLGGQKRAGWMRSHTHNLHTYITPRRPPFTVNKSGKLGTDATEYAWFVWGVEPGITILDTEQDRFKL